MSKTKIALFSILTICILAVAIFATLLIRELIIDRQSRSFFDDLASEVERRPGNDGADGAHSGQTGTEGEQPGSITWEPYVDFAALNNSFPGVVGWIKLDNTPIDYPVMQYSNNDYFLTHLPDGTEHRNGSIFLDYRNKSDFSDKSILIYGHHTRTGDMFGVLREYRNRDFYGQNPVMYLHTPETDYMIVIFAGHVADSVLDHPPMHFGSDAEFLTYVNHLKSISVFRSDVEVTASDRIVSLVTCTYDFNDARLIIVGILLEL